MKVFVVDMVILEKNISQILEINFQFLIVCATKSSLKQKIIKNLNLWKWVVKIWSHIQIHDTYE